MIRKPSTISTVSLSHALDTRRSYITCGHMSDHLGLTVERTSARWHANVAYTPSVLDTLFYGNFSQSRQAVSRHTIKITSSARFWLGIDHIKLLAMFWTSMIDEHVSSALLMVSSMNCPTKLITYLLLNFPAPVVLGGTTRRSAKRSSLRYHQQDP
jgi:hypothetical protein